MMGNSYNSDYNDEQSNNIARRKVLSSLGGGLAGTAGIVGTSNAVSATSNAPVSNERSAEASEIEEMLSDPTVESILETLSITPGKMSTDDATVYSLEKDGTKLSSILSIQTKYGVLRKTLDESDGIAYIDLEKSNIPTGIEKRISGSIGWPKNTNAKVLSKSVDKPLIFVREPTDAERENALQVTETEQRDQTSISVISELKDSRGQRAKKKREGRNEIVVFSGETITRIDYDTMAVTETTPLSDQFTQSDGISIQSHQSKECSKMAISCAADLITSAPNCGLAAAGCGFFGPIGAACALTIISICLPGVGLTILSCHQYTSSCDNPTL
ncbi:hypothetical protein [Natrinema versiforme]|uniref:Uncharacterized protein n=1 Tax=Natrinema versiforme TaxID=88724 RepID=A0A4P8WKW1_9EURY|nr:hypothetical protein [Natrinema versiforme]QCS43994.1 hypothetical protein FEJ81_17205 [Natrinema versiforme]